MTEYINFDFEGAGTPVGIVVTGTGSVDFDANTAPAPLAGSFSMELQPGSSSSPLIATMALGVSAPTLYNYFLFNFDSTPASSNSDLVVLSDNLAGDAALVSISGSVNRFGLESGSNSANGPADLVGGTTYHMWFEHTKSGAGLSDAVTRLYYSTDGVKPVSPQLEVLNGTNENDVIEVLHLARNRGYLPEYRDNIKAGDVAYEDNGTLPSTEAPGWIGSVGIKNSSGTLLDNTLVKAITRADEDAASDVNENITLDGTGIPTINNAAIGAVGATIEVTIKAGGENVIFEGQTVIDLNA